MPRMDQSPADKKLIKLLLVADGKVGKTRFAGEAAAAGFKTLFIDGDVATPTLSQLPRQAQRISIYSRRMIRSMVARAILGSAI
jgi:hypothetical protein